MNESKLYYKEEDVTLSPTKLDESAWKGHVDFSPLEVNPDVAEDLFNIEKRLVSSDKGRTAVMSGLEAIQRLTLLIRHIF